MENKREDKERHTNQEEQLHSTNKSENINRRKEISNKTAIRTLSSIKRQASRHAESPIQE